MTRRRIAAAVLVVAIALAGWLGWRLWQRDSGGPINPGIDVALPEAPSDRAETVETVDASAATLPTGGTPMAERVAVLGLLNKRNGERREVTLKPGQAVRLGDVILRLRACEKTAPWEQEPLTGAFVQMDVRGVDRHWRRAFSGWLFKERPSLNVVENAVYDVWPKSCAMTWAPTGPDTTSLVAPPARSSAKKSAAPDADEAADAEDQPTESTSAPASNAM